MATSTIKRLAVGAWNSTDVQGITVRRGNGITQVNFNSAISLNTSFTQIGTLPVGFRPEFIIYARCVGSNGAGDVTVRLFPDGIIQAAVDTGTGNVIHGIVTF